MYESRQDLYSEISRDIMIDDFEDWSLLNYLKCSRFETQEVPNLDFLLTLESRFSERCIRNHQVYKTAKFIICTPAHNVRSMQITPRNWLTYRNGCSSQLITESMLRENSFPLVNLSFLLYRRHEVLPWTSCKPSMGVLWTVKLSRQTEYSAVTHRYIAAVFPMYLPASLHYSVKGFSLFWVESHSLPALSCVRWVCSHVIACGARVV